LAIYIDIKHECPQIYHKFLMNYYVKSKPFYNSHEFIELTLIKKVCDSASSVLHPSQTHL